MKLHMLDKVKGIPLLGVFKLFSGKHQGILLRGIGNFQNKKRTNWLLNKTCEMHGKKDASGYDIILAIILSVCTVVMTRMNLLSNLFGTIEENYIGEFGVRGIILFVILLFGYYFIIRKADQLLYNLLKKISSGENEKKRVALVMRFWVIFIIVAWTPYYLSYYPGGIYADTLTSISYHMDGIFTNRHPFFYNLLISMAIRFGSFVGKDLSWSMGFFLGIQMFLLAAEIIYFLWWMLAHQIKRCIRIFAMVFMTIFPLIPLYAISIWKDTPFSMAIMLWTMFIIDLYFDILHGQRNLKNFIGVAIGALLVAFTRNNGIYVVVFTIVLFIFSTCREKYQKKYNVYGVLIFSILMVCFIQGPIYKWIGVQKTNDVESLGIPLQQIASVVAYDGEITEMQRESIQRFMPGDIKANFAPCLVDPIKGRVVDGEYLHEHKKEFLNLWLQLFLQNPGRYIREYFLETAGFWNVDIARWEAYVQNFVWENSMGLVQKDYFEKWFGFSFQHFVNPRRYISCAWFFWAFLFCGIFIMKHYGWKKICLIASQLGVWLTLMVATPIAVSLRYIAALMFTLPFVVIIPMLLHREQGQ